MHRRNPFAAHVRPCLRRQDGCGIGASHCPDGVKRRVQCWGECLFSLTQFGSASRDIDVVRDADVDDDSHRFN